MNEVTTAHGILYMAGSEMEDRSDTYDKPEGERSMASTVAAFAAITGVTMSEQQGWQFMELLKVDIVRIASLMGRRMLRWRVRQLIGRLRS